jgi:CheY-like chemotaxis protein
VLRSERGQAALRLLQLPFTAHEVAATTLIPGDHYMHEPLEEVSLLRLGPTPGLLERLVRLEVASGPREREAVGERLRNHGLQCYARGAVATILLCGVDLFFRGKLEALLSGHHLVTTDSVDPADLVIADIARIDAEEVADAYPDIPIIGFTNHTDTAGLRSAQAAGFDQVLAKSALVERVGGIVDELIGEPR